MGGLSFLAGVEGRADTHVVSEGDTKNTAGVFMQAVSPQVTVKVHSCGGADSRAVGQRILPVYSPNSQLILFAELGGLNGGGWR